MFDNKLELVSHKEFGGYGHILSKNKELLASAYECAFNYLVMNIGLSCDDQHLLLERAIKDTMQSYWERENHRLKCLNKR